MLTQDMLAQLAMFLPLSKMTSTEIQELLDQVTAHPGHSEAKKKAIEVLAGYAGEQDLPQSLTRSLQAGVSTYSFAHKFHNWVIDDPDAALDWYHARVEEGSLIGGGLSDSPQTILYGEILAALAKTDVGEALAFFESAPLESRSPLIYKLATAIAEQGPESEPHVRTLIDGLESTRDKERAVESAVWALGRTRDSINEAVEFLDSYQVSDEARSSTLFNLIMENAKELPVSKRVQWLLEHTSESYADRSLDDLFQRFSWDHGGILDNYIATQEEGAYKDIALSARASSLAQQREGQLALDSALRISEAARRKNSIRQVVHHWKGFDAEGAMHALQTADLEPAEYGLTQNAR